MEELKNLLHDHAVSMSVEKCKQTGDLVWALRSTRPGENFCYLYGVEDKILTVEYVIDFFVVPTLDALEKARNALKTGPSCGIQPAYPGVSREICKLCYHVNSVGFHVPDEVWEATLPEALWEQIVCLPCFIRLADEKSILWDSEIQLFPVSLATHLGIGKYPRLFNPKGHNGT